MEISYDKYSKLNNENTKLSKENADLKFKLAESYKKGNVLVVERNMFDYRYSIITKNEAIKMAIDNYIEETGILSFILRKLKQRKQYND